MTNENINCPHCNSKLQITTNPGVAPPPPTLPPLPTLPAPATPPVQTQTPAQTPATPPVQTPAPAAAPPVIPRIDVTLVKRPIPHRGEIQDSPLCFNCNHEHKPEDKFCPECGLGTQRKADVYCTNCNTPLIGNLVRGKKEDGSAKVCPHCKDPTAELRKIT